MTAVASVLVCVCVHVQWRNFSKTIGGSTRPATVPIHLETIPTPAGDTGTESAVYNRPTFILMKIRSKTLSSL